MAVRQLRVILATHDAEDLLRRLTALLSQLSYTSYTFENSKLFISPLDLMHADPNMPMAQIGAPNAVTAISQATTGSLVMRRRTSVLSKRQQLPTMLHDQSPSPQSVCSSAEL